MCSYTGDKITMVRLQHPSKTRLDKGILPLRCYTTKQITMWVDETTPLKIKTAQQNERTTQVPRKIGTKTLCTTKLI